MGAIRHPKWWVAGQAAGAGGPDGGGECAPEFQQDASCPVLLTFAGPNRSEMFETGRPVPGGTANPSDLRQSGALSVERG